MCLGSNISSLLLCEANRTPSSLATDMSVCRQWFATRDCVRSKDQNCGERLSEQGFHSRKGRKPKPGPIRQGKPGNPSRREPVRQLHLLRLLADHYDQDQAQENS